MARDPLEQGYAKGLRLEPAGAIEWLLAGYVALDLLRGETAKHDARLVEMCRREAGWS